MALWKKSASVIKQWSMSPCEINLWRRKISKEFREGSVIKELTDYLRDKGLHIGPDTFRTGFLQCLHQACVSGAFSFVKHVVDNHSKDLKLDELYLFHPKKYHESYDCASVSDKAQCRQETLLHAAIIGDSIEIVKLLISHDEALINKPNCCSKTPLMLSLEQQNESLVMLLLGHRMIDLNCQDSEGYTPLIYAARINSMALFIPDMIRLGANVCAYDVHGYNALQNAIVEHNHKAIGYLLEHNDSIKLLSASPQPIYLVDQGSFLSQNFSSKGQSTEELHHLIASFKLNLPLDSSISLSLLKASWYFASSIQSTAPKLLVDCKHAFYDAFIKGSLHLDNTTAQFYNGHNEILTLDDVKSTYSLLHDFDLGVVLCYESLLVRERCLGYGDPSLIHCLLLFGLWLIKEGPDASKLQEGLKLMQRGVEMLLHIIQNQISISSRILNLVIVMLHKLKLLTTIDSANYELDLWSERDILVPILENAIHCVTNCVILTKKRHTHLITHKSFLPGIQLILELLNTLSTLATEESDVKYLVEVLSKHCPRTIIDTNGSPTTLVHILLQLDSIAAPVQLLQLIIEANEAWMVNGVGPLGMRPLHLTHKEEVISLLIEYGAHMDAVNSQRVTTIKDLHIRRPDLFPELYVDLSLKCLAANAIVIQRLPYAQLHIPSSLKRFISLHDDKAEDHLLRNELDFNLKL